MKLVPIYDQPDLFAPKSTPELVNSTFSLFTAFLYGIAGISAGVSGYNSYLWFNSSNPWFIAVALSLMLVSCSIIFPAIYKRKKSKVYLRLAFVTVTLSIFATIAGQYNNYSIKHERDIALKTASNSAGLSLTQLNADEARLQASTASIRQSIEITEATIKAYLGKGWYVGAQEQLLTKYQAQLATIDNQLNEISAKKQTATNQVEKGTQARKDFYAFLAGISRVSADLMELIVSCIFAGFIDIICPLVAYNVRKE